jgi:hypothetical protein
LTCGGVRLCFEIDTGRRLTTSAVVSRSLNLVIFSSIFRISLGVDLRISLPLAKQLQMSEYDNKQSNNQSKANKLTLSSWAFFTLALASIRLNLCGKNYQF